MISCTTYQAAVHRYADGISQGGSGGLPFIQKIFMACRLAILMAYHLFFTSSVVKDIRQEMTECAETCRNGACIHRVYGRVSKIRDSYQTIQETIAKTYGLMFFASYLVEVVSLWDELAEDLFIAEDVDIATGLNRMAKNAADLKPSWDWRKELHALR